MLPLARRCARLVRLLSILWAVGRCEASQSHSQPSASVGIAPDQLLRLILQEVRESEIQPLDNRLTFRINGLDSRLIGIESRLNALDFKQDRFDSRLNELFSRVESTEARVDSRLDELVSRADSTEARVDSRLDELVSRADSTEARVDSRLDELVSRAESTEANVDSRLDELVSRAESTEANVDSRLDELVFRANSTQASVDSRLNVLISRAESTEANVDSRLDELVSRVNSTEARLDYRPAIVPRDCSELPAGSQTGVHLLLPSLNPAQPPVSAYCDLDTDGGGWTVIQRRADIKPRQDFFLGWAAYKEGFGKLDAEFWWGLDNMWTMTAPRDRRYELRVNLADFDGGRKHATYQQFRVESEADGYRLFVADYTGDAGDSLSPHSGKKFSTKDKDQDESKTDNCAQKHKGAWWYRHCYYANLNGQYLSGPQSAAGGVVWFTWLGRYSLKDVEMKIRPVNTI